jgi:hypothetical protein
MTHPLSIASIATKSFRKGGKTMNPKERKVERTVRGVKVALSWLQHHLNSVHVYCRLVRVMPKGLAKRVVLSWEKTAIYRFMYVSL